MSLHHLTPTTLLAIAVAITSVARTARLLVFDDFPPVYWLRLRFVSALPEGSKWTMLAQCPFCLSPYLATGMALWAWLSGLDPWWWWINGVWAGSYWAAILVAHDEQADG